MLFDSVFLVALQSAMALGFIHGINPCGHSWLVLAPFTYGSKDGKRVFSITSGFILGTTLACIAIGVSLGSISLAIPDSFRHVVDLTTVGVLLLLGIALIWKPHLLHSHDHGHEHDTHDNHGHPKHNHTHGENCCGQHNAGDATCCNSHNHQKLTTTNSEIFASHPKYTLGQPVGAATSTAEPEFALGKKINTSKEHSHHDHSCGCSSNNKIKKVTFWGLTVFGFLNMIVPCPTVAIMYTYGLDSGSILKSTLVFVTYAIGTGLTLATVIYAIYKATNALNALNKSWIEPLVMRTAGVLTILFAIYSYLIDTKMI